MDVGTDRPGGKIVSMTVAWAGPVQGTTVPTALRNSDLELAARLSRQSLESDPGDADVLRLLILAQIGLGDIDGACETSDRLETLSRTPETLDAVLSACLAADRIGRARDRVAEAARDPDIPAWAVEAARARIAIHQGDRDAARAILIRGIERAPEAPWLRGLLAEVLVADGRAAQAREVIDRLGQPAGAPGPFPWDEIPADQTGT